MAASHILAVRGKPVTFFSQRMPEDSKYEYQGHQVAQRREDIFQVPT